MTTERQHQILMTDLIDNLTIDQIKEVLLPEDRRSTWAGEMQRLASDIDLLIKKRRIKPNARLVRLLVFLAQANLHTWNCKDRMQKEPEKYYNLLEFAQELNGLRNHIRNLLMEELGESEPGSQRATFLDHGDERWYSSIIHGLNKTDPQDSGNTVALTLMEFARLFGTTVEDIPPDCRRIIETRDFRYRRLNTDERDRVLTTILKRIESGEMWVSGPDKQGIWEKGWSENLRNYEKGRSVAALTPQFIRSDQVLRLFREYVRPLNSHFEFDVADVYRRWAFNKYFKEVQAIYEFGCGSCQHLPVLAELFPGKELHGLDWAVASSKIIEKLVADNGWNITGHLFDLYSPDENLALDNRDGVFTWGTMEQLGRNFEPFLQFLLRKKPAVVMHVETLSELYDDSRLTDYVAMLYDRKRNYLEGYLSRLRQLESEGRIEILNIQRIFLGSMYHDSYSLAAWRPK